jgi:glycosyltransferase involved in cell wall biosynthesis
MSPRVVLVAPVPLDLPRGNAITVARIAQGLRARGLEVCVQSVDDQGIAEHARGRPPAVVHAFHAYRTGPLGLALARSRRAPLVITLTGTDVSDDLRDSTRGRVVRETLLGAMAITVFHDSVAAQIAADLPAVAARLAVVPQSVWLPPAGADGGAPRVHGDPCLLFPAGIRPVKRPLLPLAPLDRLLRELPGMKLWYAGPSLDTQETVRLERALSDRPWARYLGAVPHSTMPSLLEAADIVLNCSLSEGGMANAVLEALAFGRAVLASDIPGNRSLVEDGVTGLLFSSEAGLGRGVERLAADPGLRRRLGDAGRRLVESRFTPERETEGYLEVYARVTGGPLA